MVNPGLMVLITFASVMHGANVSRERSEVLWRQRAAEYADQPDAAAFPQLARFHGQKSAWQRRAGCISSRVNVAEMSCEMCLRTTFCCLLGDPKILEDRRRRGEEKQREVEAVKAVSRHVMTIPPQTAICADVAKAMLIASHFLQSDTTVGAGCTQRCSAEEVV
jgi:hypothetical protein